MSRKQAIRMVIYIVLILGMLFLLCNLFKYQNDHYSKRFQTYRELPAGSVDAIYIGNSAVDRYWNCAQAYEEHGMVVYPLSTDNQPGVLVRYIIEEAYRYQDPELILIDIRGFTPDALYFDNMQLLLSRFTSSIPITSPVYWKTTTAFLKMLHKADPQKYSSFDIAYYLQFINFHYKWSEEDFDLNELRAPESEYLGFYVAGKKSIRKLKAEDAEYFEQWTAPTQGAPLDPVQEELLLDLFDYIKTNNLNVLFIDTPHCYNEDTAQRFVTIENMVKDAGFDILMLHTDDMGLDISNDFYNTGHVNYYGSIKYTSYLGNYLNEHYDFPDHRNDADTKAFDGVEQKIVEAIQRIEEKYNK